MIFILDVELYLQGKISTRIPLEIDTDNALLWSVLTANPSERLYFDINGFQCDQDGTLRERPVYLLTVGNIAHV